MSTPSSKGPAHTVADWLAQPDEARIELRPD